MYKVEWTDQAEESLKKIDRAIGRKITYRVENYLVKNPTKLGKHLTGSWKERWSYRFGDYRVIYEVKENKLLIIVVKVGHRKEIY